MRNYHLDPQRKIAGLLVPVFALRHDRDYGIGDTLAVRQAIDFCAEHHFAVLQILPVHELVGDFSPYNPISSCALSPAYVTLSPEEVPGLTAEILAKAAPESWVAQLRAGPVKHASVQPLKLHVLAEAHRNFLTQHGEGDPLAAEFAQFREDRKAWLPAYTLFRVLIREYEGNPNWSEWRPEHHSFGGAETWLSKSPDRARYLEQREEFAFVQWVAWRQWKATRAHADEKGVMLMGEMSHGVGRCSADVWSRPELFDLEWNLGTPPISYFDTNKDSEKWGQNWGLPPFRWNNHRAEKFAWLRQRVATEREFFHLIRLDHLRGYFRGYQFPWGGGAPHAEFAQLTEEEAMQRTGGKLPRFIPGRDDDPIGAAMNDLQGREIIGVLQDAAGEMGLVAELMGAMPDYMRKAIDDLRMPNLVFPQLERNPDRSLQDPSTFRPLAIAAYANHDHAPIAAVYAHLIEEAKKHPEGTAATDVKALCAYLGWKEEPPAECTPEFLSVLQASLLATPCAMAAFMTSDMVGNKQRFNLPGSYGAGTWCERLEVPLDEYPCHDWFGPRLQKLEELIIASGRSVATAPIAQAA